MVFFEARKRKDLYLWVAKAPEGPSVKFHIENGEGRPVIDAVTAAEDPHHVHAANSAPATCISLLYLPRDMTARSCLQCTPWQSSSSAGTT